MKSFSRLFLASLISFSIAAHSPLACEITFNEEFTLDALFSQTNDTGQSRLQVSKALSRNSKLTNEIDSIFQDPNQFLTAEKLEEYSEQLNAYYRLIPKSKEWDIGFGGVREALTTLENTILLIAIEKRLREHGLTLMDSESRENVESIMSVSQGRESLGDVLEAVKKLLIEDLVAPLSEES